jgi:cell division septum initiation protein DivIVA
MNTPEGLDALGFETTQGFEGTGAEGGLPQFATVMRGYDRGQVDDYVARLNDFVADAEQRANRAERSVVDLTGRVERLTEELRSAVERRQAQRASAPYEGLGERIEHILRLAGEEADTIRQQARNEAEQIVSEAQRRRETERQSGERDLAAVAQQRDAVVAELRRVQDVLATLGLRQALAEEGVTIPEVADPAQPPPAPGDEDATRVIRLPNVAASQ